MVVFEDQLPRQDSANSDTVSCAALIDPFANIRKSGGRAVDGGLAKREDTHPVRATAVLCCVSTTGRVALGFRRLRRTVDQGVSAETLSIVLSSCHGVSSVRASGNTFGERECWVILGLKVKNAALSSIDQAAIVVPAIGKLCRNGRSGRLRRLNRISW
jgi:hypothetical protein